MEGTNSGNEGSSGGQRFVKPRWENHSTLPTAVTNNSNNDKNSGGGGGHSTREESSAMLPKLNPFTKKPYTPQYYKILAQRTTLPVYQRAKELTQNMRDHQVVLFVGETGSGKTTQVPQFISEMELPGVVVCTQPRRIAAMSIAVRVAAEMDVQLGEEVGYRVRFKSMVSDKTKLLYMTDGMLLREAFSDRDLSRISVVVVDEAHERTVETDVLLGVLRLLMQRRQDFRLVVMSATLDMERFQAYFPKAPLIQVEGRMYDVQVLYSTVPVKDYVEACVERVCDIHLNEPPGDILCFLTGEAEIERAVSRTKLKLEHLLADDGNTVSSNGAQLLARVLPLYGSLGVDDQGRVFSNAGKNTRKIIFATNIAETSLTIDGIVYVVDCGYHKQSLYNAEARVDYLLPAVISKASAEQRKGRAGRTRPGKCFRLFQQSDFSSFPNQTHPEVLRSNMINTVLLLLKLDVTNPYQFAFIDPPSQQSVMDAYCQLSLFGAVDDDLQLTDFGRLMADFPVDACLARVLMRSAQYGCAADAAVIVAMLETRNVLVRPASRGIEAEQKHVMFRHPDGDHLTLFKVFHAFWRSGQSSQYCFDNFLAYQALQQAVNVYTQLTKLMKKKNICFVSTYDDRSGKLDSVAIRKAVLEGFFTQVAYKPPGGELYKTVRDSQMVALHRHSFPSMSGSPSWIVYDRLEVQGQGGTFIRVASAIEPEWLLEVSDFFNDTSEFGDGEICRILQDLKAGGTTQKG
ncbi:ATP-dependent RNA helicase, putative [Trypanosoma brucei gambiense DAL972]|uniref:RNA helicase n=1 Tax=Trypanosoma brucei gambiense (strain MHOM/CI/86/DAL972) TaxID=679716 RepID=C9ZMN0_TRYB9|nr:ATP-dependent RNA helicase, putative [Trypanosoma brucei gambiense DAL972]CBH10533.1 ATP-dependent RNA helicase, putative [Trypanosoma brucei gambiense DAL972]|eukprot:XP_011772822.1 ATP-dependent RNA helicase, putative [Trypanosoma brucei gambiense DAL972]